LSSSYQAPIAPARYSFPDSTAGGMRKHRPDGVRGQKHGPCPHRAGRVESGGPLTTRLRGAWATRRVITSQLAHGPPLPRCYRDVLNAFAPCGMQPVHRRPHIHPIGGITVSRRGRIVEVYGAGGPELVQARMGHHPCE
jgi:hypothetical protein